MGIQMPRVKDDNVRTAELTAGLNKAREVGDIAEMWRCAAELMVKNRDRPVLVTKGGPSPQQNIRGK